MTASTYSGQQPPNPDKKEKIPGMRQKTQLRAGLDIQQSLDDTLDAAGEALTNAVTFPLFIANTKPEWTEFDLSKTFESRETTGETVKQAFANAVTFPLQLTS